MIIKGGFYPPPHFFPININYKGNSLCQASSLCDFLNVFGWPEKFGTEETFLIIIGQICEWFCAIFVLRFCSRLRRGDFRYTTICFQKHFYTQFVRASGEAISGTQRYFSKDFLLIFSRLRRGDFRYTTICFKAFAYDSFFAEPARQF